MPVADAKLCFHCGAAIPAGTHIHAQVRNQREAMCCQGCRAVAELIAGVGLEDYYRYRSDAAPRPVETAAPWQAFQQPEVAAQFVHREAGGVESVVLLVEGVRCAACAWLIERMLQRTPGVTRVSVNTATTSTRVSWRAGECDLVEVLRTLSSLGYRPQPLGVQGSQSHHEHERRTALKRLGVAGLGMMQVMMYVLPLYVRDQTRMEPEVAHFLQIVSLLLTTPVLLYAGWPFMSNAVRALRHRSISMDVPVAAALLLAYVASVGNTLRQQGEVYFDSVTMFIFFLTLGRYVEMMVRHRTAGVTEALARLQPGCAHRLQVDAQGEMHQEDVPLSAVAVGDALLVRVGESVPADGRIVQGSSRMDEALLTGESLPVARRQGEQVLAGTVNMEAPLHIQVTATGSHTVLAGIMTLLERTQADKPQLALLADRIARQFLNALLVFTAVVAVAWYCVDPARAFGAVLAILVVTCPCALSLATPVVIAATTTALARRGLLVTRADAIENLAQVRHMVFDKTGTLTTGRVVIAGIQCRADISPHRCRELAAALEQGADHPVARAFRDGVTHIPHAEELRVTAGAGVAGVIDGVAYRLGTPAFVAGLRDTGMAQTDDAVVVLGNTEIELARFELRDPLRSDAPGTIAQLQQLGVTSSILSGDAHSVVQRVAGECGITAYRWRQTPAGKCAALQVLQRDDAVVAMVGDGINDAPVLGAANVAIAMGNGTALAQASADVVLMGSSLQVLPEAVRLARRARQLMRQNLLWAAVYNLAAVPMAAMGMIPPWLAALGMSLSSVLVVLNATRVLRSPARRRTHGVAEVAAQCLVPT